MFAEFLATDGVSEESRLASRIGVMALHGGLEFGTSRLARQVAEHTNSSLYAVVQPTNLLWHVPSIRYDRASSGTLSDFLEHVDTIFSFHGYHRPQEPDVILLGGRNRRVAIQLAEALHDEGVPAEADMDRIPAALAGQHSANPVNGSSSHGVQLELPRAFRRPTPMPAIVSAVTNVIATLV